jgi:hypothetical protein
MTYYRYGIYVIGAVFIALGWAILIKTVWLGGGMAGYVFGALFIALGTGRIYLQLRR